MTATSAFFDLGNGWVSVVPGSSGMLSPRWSPDGRFILALFVDRRRALPVSNKTQEWLLCTVMSEFRSFFSNALRTITGSLDLV